MNKTLSNHELAALVAAKPDTYAFYTSFLREKADHNGIIGQNERFNACQAFAEIQTQPYFSALQRFKLSAHIVRRMLAECERLGLVRRIDSQKNQVQQVYVLPLLGNAKRTPIFSLKMRLDGAMQNSFVGFSRCLNSFFWKTKPNATIQSLPSETKPSAAAIPEKFDPNNAQHLKILRGILCQHRIFSRIEDLQNAKFSELFKVSYDVILHVARYLRDLGKKVNLRYFLTTLENWTKSEHFMNDAKNEAQNTPQNEPLKDVPLASIPQKILTMLKNIEALAKQANIQQENFNNRRMFLFAVLQHYQVTAKQYRMFCMDYLRGMQAEHEAYAFERFLLGDAANSAPIPEKETAADVWNNKHNFDQRLRALRESTSKAEYGKKMFAILQKLVVSKEGALRLLEQWEAEQAQKTCA